MIVDLPTKKATHFLRPIKRLSKRNQKVIKLRTIRPLLEQGQTSNEFWQKHCGLCESKITYEDINVRIPFKLLQGSPRLCTEMTLSFNVKNQEEEHLLKEALQLGSVESKVMSKEMEIHIPENGRVVSILLGSQPARVATLNYVKNFIDVARKLSKHSKPLFLFVFCADHIEGSKSSLFRDLIDLLKKQPSIPSFLSVIPFSFQSSKVIAPLFHRSIITCSRSGGVTAMELMAVSTGEIWIHSESRKKNPTLNDLLKGIPKWESENALYLFKLEGARIVTPETFSSRAEEILSQ